MVVGSQPLTAEDPQRQSNVKPHTYRRAQWLQ